MSEATPIQYLAQVCQDFVRTLPPSAAGPTAQSCRSAVAAVEAEVDGLRNEIAKLKSSDD